MNWEALGAVGEVLGAVAVVATLLYLARQTRHAREATEVNTQMLRSAARTESARYWSEEVIRMALSEDMARIVDQGMVDASQLNDRERERLVAWYTQHMVAKDALYHQHLEGVLPDDAWYAHEQVMLGILRYDSFLKSWDAGFLPVSREFRMYVESLRANLPEGEWGFADKARVFDA